MFAAVSALLPSRARIEVLECGRHRLILLEIESDGAAELNRDLTFRREALSM